MEDKVQGIDLTKKRGSIVFFDKLGFSLTFISAIILIITTASIYIFVASKGFATFFVNGVNIIDFLTGTEWNPLRTAEEGGPLYGTFPFIFGSFAVTFMAALISAPLGIGAAVFMTEIAPSWGQKILQPVIELLVGIPSVVYGFIGLTLVVPFIRNYVGGLGFGLLAGTIVLAVMILPTITSISVDTLRAVPREMKEGSYALGATRWQTIYRILFRASIPGFITAVVFGMARAFGEALAVQMVLGNAPLIPKDLVSPASTITSIITINMGHTVSGSAENNVLWSLALLLLAMSALFIFVIRMIAKRRRFTS
ncbi:phosphate ABC transporter (permease) [[Clostridium] ultunense Esp]|uniref:phosphate ABC transporter permease subunit PstC n=1 Tax=Thermicanus aegyptius TaxID=94009 RepID=UPI0002B6FAB4|nr:phosphate ABC transporter permease subunit PstC [Thermicanus aegyptius]CCQ93609.1 phosphate ABC transporter (permease) [[Clostridium] ultunense Esp]